MGSLIALHVVANLVWIGSAMAVALLLAKGPGDAKTRGAAGRLVYRTLAVPAFVVSFVAGVVLLAMNPTLYFHASHWMHAKLPLALVVIGLHHVLGARARRMEAGTADAAGPAMTLGIVVFACAAASAALALLKPF